MKKLLVGLLVACFLVMPILCFAQGETHSQVIYTEIIDSSTVSLATAIPVTKIRPDVDKIIGMQIFCLPGSVAGTAALYDTDATSGIATAEIIAEYEATSTYQASGIFFPFPRSIVNGISVCQDKYTRVIIYYVRQ